MAQQHFDGSKDSGLRRSVERMLSETHSFRYLDGATQQALTDALSNITEYLAGSSADGSLARPLATQLAPTDLEKRLAPQTGSVSSPAPVLQSTAPGQPAAGPAPAPGQSATGRVGEVARATLNAIDFPQFVGSLIEGTFQAIVSASIRQMEAYAELLKNVASTVDRFMSDNITDATARDYLADQYDGFLVRDTSGGQPRLRVRQDGRPQSEMPSFFKDLGFETPSDINDRSIEETLVPAARRNMAERRQQTLATMVLMGINRVVVDDGEISAKLMFHIDASETTNLRFDQTKTTAGNISGRAGTSPFTANAIMVNTTSLNAQSDINVRADLTGQVKVRFRSETFPLERFADSAAIQLINQNAKVPQPLPAPGAAAPGAAAGGPPGAATPSATVAGATPPAAQPAPAPAAQSLGSDVDPWAPTEDRGYGLE